MALKCGIVGLPNVGKSTLFNSITKSNAKAQNFPFCTVEPNIGIVDVPDKRLDELASILKPEKTTPASVELVDIAGLVEGANKGEGLGNKFLGHIRETQALIHVLRCFDDPNIAHINGSVNPARDKEIVDYELLMKDLETVERAILKVEKPALSGDQSARAKMDVYTGVKAQLEQGIPCRALHLDKEASMILQSLFLITAKPVLYVCNVDERSFSQSNKYVDMIRDMVKKENSRLLLITAAIEAEISNMESEEDKKLFLNELGLKEPGINRLIREAYSLLGLISFFTAGKKEVRAWTIKKGSSAQQAAGEIHSDMERGFICAEVTKFNDYISLGSEHLCKEAGLTSTVGRDYVIHDGDVVYFRFNV